MDFTADFGLKVSQVTAGFGYGEGYYGQKLKGWSHKLETLHEDNVGPILKKARKQQIYGGSPSL